MFLKWLLEEHTFPFKKGENR